MADTFGFSLDITGLDNALLAAQGHLTSLEKESQKTQQRMVDMFRAIATQGVDAYLQKLYDTKAVMEMVANTKLSGNNPLFKQIQDDATKSIDAVNTLIDALAKASGVQAPTSSTADKERNRAIQEANNQAILNAEKARKEYEGQYRMYEKMFEQADKKHPEIIEVGNAQQQLNAVEKEMDRLIERIAKLHNEIEIFKSMESGNTLNTEDYKYIGKASDEINKLIDQYEKLDKEQQKISKNLKDLKTSPTSYEGAMRTSGKADTYEREKKAIEVLTIARDNLSKTDADYATKLNALNEAIRKHQENLKNATLTDQERAEAEQAVIDKEVANYDKLLSKIKELEEQKAQAEQIQEELGPQKQGEVTEVTEMRNKAAESEAEAIKELQDLNDKKEDLENKHQDKLDKVKQKHRAKELQEEKKNLDAKRKAQEHATPIRNYQQNPQSARETKSIQEQILAIKRLKEARDTLDRSAMSKKEYEKKVRAINKELARQEQQVARLQNKSTGAFGKMTGMAGQLGDRIKAAFSVAAITGFVNKLIQVRGAMEKNQTALQIILRDKDAANEVWDKTVALAVKSPFTVNQLIGYTKQLAAYRIENDKLYDTTKRLADMSAGLGVDMSRLILAYGQVRAATYLRATEVRQFTEAGVPLLEELADYLTQVEQRTVTVGEVMERVSKRGVQFKDVEAVLKRMTDEGGVFYQMQEKQSQTTWGMVSNLKDEIELMFNDIGAANDGAIKGSLSLIRTLVREWRKLLPIVTTLAGMFAAIFAGKGIIALIRMVMNLTTALRGAVAVSRALSLSMLTNPYLAVAAAIGAIAGAIIGWGEETDRLKAKLIQIDEEVFGDLTDAIETYKELAEEVKNAVKGSMEYNEALRKMKERYGEILSDELLHAEYLERTTDGYALATEAMREYYANKAIERKKDAIETKYSEDITDQQREIIEELEEYFGELKSEGRMDYAQYTQALAAIRPVVRKMVEDLKSGELQLYGYSDAATNEIFDRINEYLGSAGRDYGAEGYRKDAEMAFETIQDNANNLVRKAQELNDEMNDIIALTPDFATAADAAASAEFQTTKARFEEFVSLMEKYKALVINFNEGNIAENAYNTQLSAISNKMTTTSSVLFSEFKNAFGNIGYTSGFEFGRQWNIAYNNWAKNWHYTGNNNLVNQFEEQIDANAKEKLESKTTKLLNDAITNAVRTVNLRKGTNIDLDLFKSVMASNDKSYQQWLQQMEEMRDRYADYVKTFSEGTQTQIEALKASGIDKESTKAVLAIIELLIGAKKTKGSGRTSNIWKERIDLIEKMRKSYVDLRKTFANDTLKRVEDSYRDIFKELLGGFDKVGLSYQEVLNAITSDKSTAEIMDTLLSVSKLKSGTKEYRELAEAIAKVRTEIDVASKTAQDSGLAKFVDKLFEAYELFKDISELNLAPFTTSQLFGIDVASLPMLKKSIETLRDQFVGTDMEKKYQEYLDKVEEMERKAVQDRIKTYAKYLKKAESERMEIMRKSAQDIAEVERLVRDKHFTEEQGRMATAAIRKETEEALAKAEFDAFKDSPLYDLLFQDMTNLPISVLAQLRKELERIKGTAGLTWKQIREINKQINQIDKLTAQGNSFSQNFKTAINYIKNREQLEVQLSNATLMLSMAQQAQREEEERLASLRAERAKIEQDVISNQYDMANATQEQVDAYARLVAAYNTKVNAEAAFASTTAVGSTATDEERTTAQTNQTTAQNAYNDSLYAFLLLLPQYNTLISDIGKAETGLDKANKLVVSTGQQVENTTNEIEDGKNALSQTEKDIQKWGKAINNALQGMDAFLDSLGVAEEDSSRLWIQMAMQVANMILQVIALQVQLFLMGVAANSALGIIGIIAISLTTVAGLLSSIFGNKDAKLQKKIEDVQRQVDKLSRQFDKLKEAIDEAFSINQMKTYSRQALANIEQQIDGYERMIALEKDKKDTDWDKVTEMENNIDDLKQQYQELIDEAFSTATSGILDSTRDAASEFVDAWLEAFTETGEGLSGLEEHFEEVILDMIKQQASLLIAGQYLDKWKKELEKFINIDDLELTTQEAANWAQTVKGDMPQLSEALEAFFKSFESAGIDLTPGGEELSGLQKGIEGITEDTAQALEALLNSIRFFVAQDNQNLTNLTQMFTSTDSTVNPMLAQMKIIAKQTSAIYSLLDGLVKGGHPLGGGGLKVFIN